MDPVFLMKKCQLCRLSIPQDAPFCKPCRVLYSMIAAMIIGMFAFFYLADNPTRKNREAHVNFIRQSEDLSKADQQMLDRKYKVNPEAARETNRALHE